MIWGHRINLRRAEISIFALSVNLVLLLVQAGVAIGGVDPLGEELKALDVRGLLLPLAVRSLCLFPSVSGDELTCIGSRIDHIQFLRSFHGSYPRIPRIPP